MGSSSWLGESIKSKIGPHNVISIGRRESDHFNYHNYENVICSNISEVIVCAVDYCRGDLNECVEFNVIVLGKLISHFLSQKIRVVFFSSFFAKDLNNTDNYPYASAKVIIESAFKFNPYFKVLRLEHIYGPNDKASKLIPSFIRSVSENKSSVYKVIGIKRDFVWLEDVIEALENVLKDWNRYPNVLEIGNGAPIDAAEVFGKIIQLERAYNVRLEVSTSKIRASYSKMSIEELICSKPKTLEVGLSTLLNG